MFISYYLQYRLHLCLMSTRLLCAIWFVICSIIIPIKDRLWAEFFVIHTSRNTYNCSWARAARKSKLGMCWFGRTVSSRIPRVYSASHCFSNYRLKSVSYVAGKEFLIDLEKILPHQIIIIASHREKHRRTAREVLRRHTRLPWHRTLPNRQDNVLDRGHLIYRRRWNKSHQKRFIYQRKITHQ